VFDQQVRLIGTNDKQESGFRLGKEKIPGQLELINSSIVLTSR
jgi:hypothetical protein